LHCDYVFVNLRLLVGSMQLGLTVSLEVSGKQIRASKVDEIVVSWGKADLVKTNLEQLWKKHRQKMTEQEKFLAAIGAAEKEH